MNNPRELALASLIKWDTQQCFSNLEINTVLSRARLEKNDASLYTLLYLGVIEKKLFLDNIIGQYSKSPIEEIDVETKNAIRLGLYQLIFTDRIPDYSAVDQSVSIAPKRARGFVNAVLRGFLRNQKKISYPNDGWQSLCIEYSFPTELANLLRESYGDSVAEEMIKYESRDKSLSIRVNTLKATPQSIAKELSDRGFEPSFSSFSPDVIKCIVPVNEIKDLIY